MPTENRSSNTEMAAGLLPCPFCGGINLHIEAYSVQPDNYHGARVQCMDCEFDAPCGITLKDGGWSSNPEDAKADAATVWNTRVQPAAQHQGEPVAYAVFAANGNIRIWSTNCEAVGIKVMQEEGKQAVPLYLHPPTSDGFSAGDMADQGAKAFAARDGEVERLRAALKFYADREHYHFESGNWDTVSGEPLNILWCGDDPDFIEDGTVARNALSASAEPSAPVEPSADEVRQQHYDEFMQRRETRAALERKP